jgi:P27 family predicted phage terminase small subunit
MAMGRKPKPTHLKLVTGNPGRRPLPAVEAQAAPALPSPPPHLSDDAKVEWGRVSEELYKIGLLSGIDRASLAAYCQSYGRWAGAERAIAEMGKRDMLTGGLMIKTSNGNAIQNPLVGTANKAMSDMVRYAAEFGMTPSARSRIIAAPPGSESQDPAADYLA